MRSRKSQSSTSPTSRTFSIPYWIRAKPIRTIISISFSRMMWDLEVLGGLLISAIGQFFVESYGVRMRGGYFRFQAQYLRRIRVPDPKTLYEDSSKSIGQSIPQPRPMSGNTDGA